MGRDVFFTPTREGWQHAADPTGLRGRALRVAPGGSATLRLERTGPTPACDAPSRRAAAPVTGRAQLFRIDVIDAATGRGVPLIELRTPDGASYWTDNQGIVAFDDLTNMGAAPALRGARATATGCRIRAAPLELESRQADVR